MFKRRKKIERRIRELESLTENLRAAAKRPEAGFEIEQKIPYVEKWLNFMGGVSAERKEVRVLGRYFNDQMFEWYYHVEEGRNAYTLNELGLKRKTRHAI